VKGSGLPESYKNMGNRCDWIPGDAPVDEQLTPPGFEFWKPEWKLVDGKIVKPKVEVVEEKSIMEAKEQPIQAPSHFQCNHCDFTSEHEPAIKAHITRKHKK